MKAPGKLKAATIKAILKHAEEGYPKEICGVVVISGKTEKYVPCVNIAVNPTDEFVICPESFAAAEDIGTVVGIVHSHPDGTTRPSGVDLAVMGRNREIELMVDPESHPIPWHIVSWPEGDYRQVEPVAPQSILDRPFVHGVWDCWASCETYYGKYHDITFPAIHRDEVWWENQDTTSLYEHHLPLIGFHQVNDLRPGDLIVMQIGRSYHPNHAAVYLGEIDGEFEGRKFFGKTLMLHHMYNKLSEVAVYGGQWSQRTRMIFRHKDIKHDRILG